LLDDGNSVSALLLPLSCSFPFVIDDFLSCDFIRLANAGCVVAAKLPTTIVVITSAKTIIILKFSNVDFVDNMVCQFRELAAIYIMLNFHILE
jgi:hypothetical protein